MQLHVYASHLTVLIGTFEYRVDVELYCASGLTPVGLYCRSTGSSRYRNEILCCIFTVLDSTDEIRTTG